MQRVTPGIRDAFVPVEEVMRETFLPALFQGLGEGAPVRGVNCLLVKKAGLALPELTKTSPQNWTTSYIITFHLISALRGQEEFQTAYQPACL